MPVPDLPGEPSLEHLKNQARTLQRRIRAGDPDAVAAVREFHPRPAAVTGESPGLARFALADAHLVIARRHGFASWARLRQSIEVVIRPVASPRELARAFELIGARRAPALEQDRYFLDLARRFPDDRPLMLAAERDEQLIGAGFAFRKDPSPACRTATLRNVAVRPPYRGLGLERRLIQRIDRARRRQPRRHRDHSRRAPRRRTAVLPEHGLPRTSRGRVHEQAAATGTAAARPGVA